MTGKTFRTQIYLTIALLLSASLLTLLLGVQHAAYEEASRSIITVYIGVAAAWLTFCLQRRVAYINALRSFWERLVKTVQCANQYLTGVERNQGDFDEIILEFCCRIDEMRGVFRNIAEKYERPTAVARDFVRGVKHSKSSADLELLIARFPDDSAARGLYPYESLKQMMGLIEKLGHGPAATAERAATAAKAMMLLWRILRAELLNELDRDFPEFPDTPYRRRSKWAAAVNRALVATGLRSDSGA